MPNFPGVHLSYQSCGCSVSDPPCFVVHLHDPRFPSLLSRLCLVCPLWLSKTLCRQRTFGLWLEDALRGSYCMTGSNRSSCRTCLWLPRSIIQIFLCFPASKQVVDTPPSDVGKMVPDDTGRTSSAWNRQLVMSSSTSTKQVYPLPSWWYSSGHRQSAVPWIQRPLHVTHFV